MINMHYVKALRRIVFINQVNNLKLYWIIMEHIICIEVEIITVTL